MTKTKTPETVLPECERRFKVAEARLNVQDSHITKINEKSTEALVKIDNLANIMGETNEKLTTLTVTLGALNTHLTANDAVTEERFKLAGTLASGVWVLVVGLAGALVAVMVQYYIGGV